MKSLWIVLALFACDAKQRREREVDPATFHQMLRDEPNRLEIVHVAPTAIGEADYSFTVKTDGIQRTFHASFQARSPTR